MGNNDKPKPLSDEELARLLVDLECLKGRSLQRLIATIDRERAARIDAELEHGHAAQYYLKMEDERDAAIVRAEAAERDLRVAVQRAGEAQHREGRASQRAEAAERKLQILEATVPTVAAVEAERDEAERKLAEAEEDTKIALDSSDELLRQAVAAQAKLAEAIEALEWYAAGDWEPNIGDVARKALARLQVKE